MKASNQAQSVAAQVAGLPNLTMKDLWDLWDRYFQKRPKHHNRGYVEGRVAYKIQEKVFGGVKPETRQQLLKIGESLSRIKTRRTTELKVVPGSVLIREFDDREHRVTAQADGTFEYEGRKFKSLSAVARHITGTQWSGPLFFGLVKLAGRTK